MKTAIPIPGRHALRQLEQALHALAADPRAQAPLAQAQQARQQLEQALSDHLAVLREAELALSCVLTLLLRHDEEQFAGKALRVLLEPFQQQMEVALHGLEGLR
ncbi:hypothetical protein VI26_11530 [Chromobacterium sp. LK1]|uniref:DUF1484 family protein n=1 Tax=Chromobacterium sp. LK1 TaxID=1628193 RepID=UPI000653A1A1|nr:DUF1484 family protein [Chromobacterium sp. LK1]KMN35405.1 hypothetical protein VI26_11530 [Chromobacterium sp. LK1]